MLPDATPRAGEFDAFVAALMAVNALGVDLMLTALPDIGRDLAVAVANQRQWVVMVYTLGFGVGQLVYGPLADRLGRRPVLLTALAGFVGATLFVGLSATFPALLAARGLQGLMAAATRVLAVAIVRDRYEGRAMARVMSLSQMIFFLVPILAPSIGQVLLTFVSWRGLFVVLACFAAVILCWSAARLSESLPVERRMPLSPVALRAAYALTLGNRYSLGYAVAAALTFGGIIAYVSSAQQIFVEEFGAGRRFTVLFAACALAMACGSFANSRLVGRLGTRRISQTAVLALIVSSAAHVAVIATGGETLAVFVGFQAFALLSIGLCGANFGAMAMEPVGRIAGTASSVQGCITSVAAVGVGALVGQAYDGSTLPLAVGNLAIGVVTLGVVAVIERGRLFQPHNLRTM